MKSESDTFTQSTVEITPLSYLYINVRSFDNYGNTYHRYTYLIHQKEKPLKQGCVMYRAK